MVVMEGDLQKIHTRDVKLIQPPKPCFCTIPSIDRAFMPTASVSQVPKSQNLCLRALRGQGAYQAR